MQKRTPVFVISSGRCGSSLLSDIFELHPQVLSLSEVLMAANTRAFTNRRLKGSQFWQLFASPRRTMSKILTPQTCPNEFKYPIDHSARYTLDSLPPILFMTLPRLDSDPDTLFDELASFMGRQPNAELSIHYRTMFDWLCDRFGRRVWVERSGASLIFLSSLIDRFPDGKFIHLCRDGRDVALSMQCYPPLKLLAVSWSRAKSYGLNFLKPPFKLGESRILSSADKMLDAVFEPESILQASVDLATVGKFWSAMVTSAIPHFSHLPTNQLHILKFEDLVRDPVLEVTRLIKFIGIDTIPEGFSEEIAKFVKEPMSRRATLTSEQATDLQNACEPGLRALGYV